MKNRMIIPGILVATLLFWTAGISAEKGTEKKDVTRKVLTAYLTGERCRKEFYRHYLPD